MTEPLTLTAVQRAAAIVGALLLLVWVLTLIYRGRLREDYGALWLLVAAATVLLAIWEEGLRGVARVFDAVTLTAPIFLLSIAFLTAIAIHFSVRLSEQARRITRLAQELALIRHRLETFGEEREPPSK